MSRHQKGLKMKLKKEKKAFSEVSVEKIFFLALSYVADILSRPKHIRLKKVKRTIHAKILRGESFPE